MIKCTDDWMRIILSFIWEFIYKVGVYSHAYETKCYVSWWKIYLNGFKNGPWKIEWLFFFDVTEWNLEIQNIDSYAFNLYMDMKYYHLIYTDDVIKSKLFWKTRFECVSKNKCWNFQNLFSFLFPRLSQDSRVSFRLITKLFDHSILYK